MTLKRTLTLLTLCAFTLSAGGCLVFTFGSQPTAHGRRTTVSTVTSSQTTYEDVRQATLDALRDQGMEVRIEPPANPDRRETTIIARGADGTEMRINLRATGAHSTAIDIHVADDASRERARALLDRVQPRP